MCEFDTKEKKCTFKHERRPTGTRGGGARGEGNRGANQGGNQPDRGKRWGEAKDVRPGASGARVPVVNLLGALGEMRHRRVPGGLHMLKVRFALSAKVLICLLSALLVVCVTTAGRKDTRPHAVGIRSKGNRRCRNHRRVSHCRRAHHQ